ncbi:MAG: tyrosine-type recombinase/integrase [Bacteroidetes bacterium]|nr:tyrosine-type recombinase/integrase [Bacteroidota bacterium]
MKLNIMASVNYYLKGAISEKQKKELEENDDKKLLNELMSTPLQIYLNVSTVGNRIQIYTKKRIEQKYWDKSKQLYDSRKYRINVAERNKWLSDLKFDTTKLVDINELNAKITTKEELKELLENRSSPIPLKTSLVSLLDEFIIQHTTKDGNPLRTNSHGGYKSLKYHLNMYSKEIGKTLKPEDVSLKFMKNFKEFLSVERIISEEKVISLSDTTVATIIKRFKTFNRYLISKEIIRSFDLSEIRSVEKEGTVIVLKPDEVLLLQNADLTEITKNQIRDIFCFQCWTGQRFSDVINLEHEDIIKQGDEWKWVLVVSKTQVKIEIPIVDYAKEILLKYQDHEYPIPRYSNQLVNQTLKEIAKDLKLNRIISVEKYHGGMLKTKNTPLYNVLTSHVGRKSFITNGLMLGIQERIVRDISGHKDERSFRRYVNYAEGFKSGIIKDAFSKEKIQSFIENQNSDVN